MPGGSLFASKNIADSNFRKLLLGMAGELFRSNGYLKSYSEEILPDETNLFLGEWESALGIPDSCFDGTGTNDERRRNVLVKLASLGVQTQSDFKELAALFGVDVEVNSGAYHDVFPLAFPIIFFDNATDARFTIVVTFHLSDASRFPLEFPFIFGDKQIEVLECLFNKLKPANCDIIFRQV